MALEEKRVLFISYNGMLDPLGQTQVIPYLRELGRRGVKFTLLSFERRGAFEPAGVKRCRSLQIQLSEQNVDWHWLRYHQRPSLPATIYDVLAGIRTAQKLVKQNHIEMVHARAQIPATIALALKKHYGIKMIFDIRGLMAEEYVDAHHWKQGSIPYRLTKAMETRALAAADGVVTLTRKIWPVISEWKGLRGREVVHEVVPCCTDLELFRFRPEDRERRRKELGLDDKLVLVYSGSIDGWYLTEKMAEFFAHLKTGRQDAHFLWLTHGSHERIRQLMRANGLSESDYTAMSVSSRDVPSHLSASDAGLAFIKPSFSKQASSPTKYGEYLACGLPLIINAGVGDSDDLMMTEGIGVLVGEFNESEYTRAALALNALTKQPSETRKRTRGVAEKLFDVRGVGVESYARLYETILG
ncbi:MAG: glycosyltransferase family 4 protein [Blastocatellia bacterium]|nr:glycosyltransferase family 4 protein [Blastocatellia bacterium]